MDPEQSQGDEISPPDDEALREAAARLGYPSLPEPVVELADPARRSRDLAILAGEGAGVEVLYALAAASTCDPDSAAVQGLVLTPTPERGARVGRALHLLGAPVGLASLAWSSWRASSDEERPFAQLVAGRPTELLPRVRGGRMSLAELRLVVVDGVSALDATGQWDAAEAILDTLPSDAQEIVVDVERSERFASLLKHRLGRARKWPAELFDASAGAPGDDGPPLVWASGTGEEERYERLADLLRRIAEDAEEPRAVVRCPDGDTAHRVAAALASLGFDLTHEGDEPGVVVAWGEDEPPPTSVGVLFGLPLSLQELLWLEDAAARGAVVAASEEAQLRLTARRAGWTARALPGTLDVAARDAIEGFRRRVRERLEGSVDAVEGLVLEPLLEAHGAVPVARALSGLLRETGGVAPTAPEAPAERPSSAVSEARGRRPPPRREAAESTWTRLFVNAGERDDVGPGDLVGAITGETSLTGDQIGRIEVRESYSLVDVATESAEEVMERLTGVEIRGREVVARRDKKSS